MLSSLGEGGEQPTVASELKVMALVTSWQSTARSESSLVPGDERRAPAHGVPRERFAAVPKRQLERLFGPDCDLGLQLAAEPVHRGVFCPIVGGRRGHGHADGGEKERRTTSMTTPAMVWMTREQRGHLTAPPSSLMT